MNQEELQRLRSQLPDYGVNQSQAQASSGDSFDWFKGFVDSTIAGAGELIGIRPSYETETWRQDNPLAAFTSELFGVGVPYLGWYKATKAVKRFDNAINALGNVQTMPVRTGALREAARFMPFEAGRVAVSHVVGDTPVDQMLGDAALNLAIGAGVGGVLEGIMSAGRRNVPLGRLAPGVDLDAPVQLQTRYIQSLLDNGETLPDQSQLYYRMRELRGVARGETLPQDVRYVDGLEGLAQTGNQIRDLNRLFTPGQSSWFGNRNRFIESLTDFRSQASWQETAQAAGLGANFEDWGQYFREIHFSGNRAELRARNVDRTLTGMLQPAGDGWLIGRETGDGLFVMAKKFAGDPAKASATDRWVLFKTDTPGHFAQESQNFANSTILKASWSPTARVAADGGEVYNAGRAYTEAFPLHNYKALASDPRGIGAAVRALQPKGGTKQSNELLARFADLATEYLAPARSQFLNNPRAQWIHQSSRAIYDAAENQWQRLVDGVISLDEGKNLFWGALKSGGGQLQDSGSLRATVNALSDTEVEELWKIWRQGLTGEGLEAAVARGEISTKAAEAAEVLDNIEGQIFGDLQKAQKAAGETASRARQGHLGLSRQWEGDTQIALRDEANGLVAIASGPNKRAAQQRAEELRVSLADEGRTVKIAEEFNLSDMTEINTDLKLASKSPGFLHERSGVRGFRWDTKAFTKEELIEALSAGARSRLRYQADLTVKHLMEPHLARLSAEDPHQYKLLVARMNDLARVQSPFDRVQNQLADKLLAPMLGQNSASKIVAVSNNVMWHLNLGAGKMSYPIINMFQILQTVAPEVAMITTAQGADLGAYTYFAAGGTRGPVGAFGALNPLKMVGKSLQEMRKPDAALVAQFERAVNERVVDPRLVEEYIGESASKVSDLRAAFSGPEGFVGWLRAASEFLPAMSERFVRAQAFTTGHIVARDLLKITNEDMAYRFAKEFTERTSYLYSTADRPRALTTPVGSMFGLFKNWMFNYMAAFAEYTGQGLAKNNWAPLLWQTAGTMATGGVAATPAFFVADGFANAFADQSLVEVIYNNWAEEDSTFADSLFFGLPAGLTGVSLYSQAASPLANPIRDASFLFGTAHLDRMEYMGRAVGGAWDHWQATGEHPGRSDRVMGQIARAVAPTTLYRIMGAAQEGQITSLSTGNPIAMDVPLSDKLAYMLGFNPTEIDRGYAVADSLYNKQAAQRAAVGRLGQAFADAQMNRDSQTMRLTLRQAVIDGLDPSSVLRSAMSRIQRMTTPHLERTFSPADLVKFENALGGS